VALHKTPVEELLMFLRPLTKFLTKESKGAGLGKKSNKTEERGEGK